MDVSIIEEYEAFAALEDEWNDLLKRSSFLHPQLTWDWFDTSWRHLEDDVTRLAVFRVTQKGILRGIAPLMIVHEQLPFHRVYRIRTLSWIMVNADVVDFIVDDGKASTVIEHIWAAIFDFEGWDLLALDRVSSMSPNFILHHQICARYHHALRPVSWTLQGGNPILPIDGDFDEYFEKIRKSKAIADIDRRLKRLQESGTDIRYEIATQWDDKLDMQLKQLAEEKLEVTDHPILLADSRYTEWLSDIRRKYDERGYWLIYLIYNQADDGKPIAYAICFLFSRAIYYWTVAYDPAYARFSIGKLLLKSVLKESWNRQIDRFDFMFGAENYKMQWKPDLAFQFRLSIARSRIKAAWCLMKYLKPLFKRLIVRKSGISG